MLLMQSKHLHTLSQQQYQYIHILFILCFFFFIILWLFNNCRLEVNRHFMVQLTSFILLIACMCFLVVCLMFSFSLKCAYVTFPYVALTPTPSRSGTPKLPVAI